MHQKLAIRRIGAILPTISLVALLFLCLAVAWLSTVGLPQAALRYIEKAAAQEGFPLKIDAIKLQPSKGLAFGADNIRLYGQQEEGLPLATLRQASVGINATRLLTGRLKLDDIQLEGGSIRLPVSDTPGATLEMKADSLSAHMGRSGAIALTSGRFRLQGIPIHVQGFISPEAWQGDEPEESQAIDVPALLRQYASGIDAVYHQIEGQHWQAHEWPSLDIQLKWRKQPHVNAQARVPRYDWDKFRFRDIAANVAYEGDKLIINSLQFNTIEPNASVALQAGYDMGDRTMSFSIESNAALLEMAKSVAQEETKALLSQFYHDDDHSPHILLKGDIGFEPDFSLHHATVIGNLAQEQLHIGSHCVEQMELSFYYHNGDFNINRLHLQFPYGWLNASASSQKGDGKAQVEASLPVEKTLSFINELAKTSLALPEGLQLEGNLGVKAEASLTTPLFEPGQTNWHDFVPSLHRLAVELGIPGIAYFGHKGEKAQLQLEIDGLSQGEDFHPQAAEKLKLGFSAESLSLALPRQETLTIAAPKAGIFLQHASLAKEGGISVGTARVETSLQEAARGSDQTQGLEAHAQCGQLEWNDGALHIASADAHLQAGKTKVAGAEMDSLGFNIANIRDLAPLGTGQGLPGEGSATMGIQGLTCNGHALGDLTLEANAAKGKTGQIAFDLSPKGNDAAEPQGSIAHLRATHDWTQKERVQLRDVEFLAAPAALEELLASFGAKTEAFLLPEKLEVRGDADFSLAKGRLEEATVQLRIPNLVRTPGAVKRFKGREIPVSLDADAILLPAQDGGIAYRAAFKAAHESGAFEGSLEGESNSGFSIRGKSTISLDVLDSLIDLNDAHEIMRDFRVTPQSKTTISDIDVQVSYGNGLRVDSFCNVALERIDYLMGAIEVDEAGNERLRTDMGKNPYTAVDSCSCSVTAKVRQQAMQDGKELPAESVATIGNAIINYNNRPWFARHDYFKAQEKAPRQSALAAERIIIDIEHSFVELVNVKGNVYPAYALGMFYPDLESYMEDIELPLPAQVETVSCVFPIYSDCTRPMSGAIRVEAPEAAGFRFLGTTIPLERFSGFISLSDDYVLLDRLNAKSWEGVLNAAVKIGITGKRTSFDGFASAENMNLRPIAAAYDSKQGSALVNANIRFRSPSPELSDIQAYGEGVIANGNLMSLGLFQPIGDLISDIPGHLTELESTALNRQASKPGLVSRLATKLFKSTGNTINKLGSGIDWTSQNIPGLNHVLAYDLQNAYIRFNILQGHLRTETLKAKGYNLSVHANLDIDLDTMGIRGNLWPRISSLPSVILSPLTFLSDFMIDIVVYGSIDNIQWRFGLDRRLKNSPPSATDEPGDPAYKPATAR